MVVSKGEDSLKTDTSSVVYRLSKGEIPVDEFKKRKRKKKVGNLKMCQLYYLKMLKLSTR